MSSGTKQSRVAEGLASGASAAGSSEQREQLLEVLGKHWGYDSFRPLQLEAMQAVLNDRDSVVVFPTGGGKSLCFQAPALCRAGVGIVISPLISLMKDQVDALKTCGIRAAVLNSSLTGEQEGEVLDQVRLGELDLLYLAPERLLTARTEGLLASAQIAFFAIDEAHCVSQWGHDFRPEYRGLKVLKEKYPGVGIHAYTATATEQVRADIAQQLALVDPQILVGSMDRPNLTYQVRRRESGLDQLLEVMRRHPNESGIVYCISRKDVESTTNTLNMMGISALPYHAGLSSEQRKENQDAFLLEKVDVMVATVAFGMGIDKSNVRYVIHASMPKSLEAYQQESGRAGRDGLDAECWLFYNGGDFVTWRRMMERGGEPPGAAEALQAMSQFCSSVECRHVALARHFGERLDVTDCGACDVCLDGLDVIEDALTVAQKIVSCVFRVDQRFGADYVAQVLTGSRDSRILSKGHDRVSTYGLMKEFDKSALRHWIEQLVGQGFLCKAGEYQVLNITDTGRELLRGQATPVLTKPPSGSAGGAVKPRKVSESSWVGVDRELFEKLKSQRSEIAEQRQIAVDAIFSDASLRDMARRRPSNADTFRLVLGVGREKLTQFSEPFLDVVGKHCAAGKVAMDVAPVIAAKPKKAPSKSAIAAFPLFEQGLSIEAVAQQVGRANSTVQGYLAEFISFKQISDLSPWVDDAIADRVRAAVQKVGHENGLKPIFIALDEEVDYTDIKIVLASLDK